MPKLHRAFALLAFASLLVAGCEGALAVEPLSSRPGGGGGGGGGPMINPGGGGSGGGGVTILGDDAGPGGGETDAGPGACVPMCTGRACGPDGCGGTCGQCAQGQVCDEAGQCAAPPSMFCPPTGSEGTSPGSIAPDLSFPLEGGGTMSIRDTCANRTTLIYYFAEWCGYCRTWMRDDAARVQADLEGDGFQLIIYYAESYNYRTPSEADAARIRTEYGLGEIPIGIGDENAFLQTFRRAGPQVKLLMEEGNVIAAPIGPMGDSTVRSVARR